ncbi:hypothetical protein [Yinghuangia soli]|uniref:Uncharacterized protein n=1 Tax=Yinghuangia soli TaxID=2908204 RepID=A0AA41TZA0_9ACTN|nr:hypothetical protein [Yinghuangia soli]MCF2527055.1 hypothetical protein [Yinghuangia soli]
MSDSQDVAEPSAAAEAADPDTSSYCATPSRPRSSSDAQQPVPVGPPYADCVQCGKPTEYPAAQRGITLCPVCEWQADQRGACSG